MHSGTWFAQEMVPACQGTVPACLGCSHITHYHTRTIFPVPRFWPAVGYGVGRQAALAHGICRPKRLATHASAAGSMPMPPMVAQTASSAHHGIHPTRRLMCHAPNLSNIFVLTTLWIVDGVGKHLFALTQCMMCMKALLQLHPLGSTP